LDGTVYTYFMVDTYAIKICAESGLVPISV
jgi:hypothetical protein